ncbi:hypothetical protein EXU48_07075 [Occultella glacieicola]|uniref:DUF8094 domain-containing protein n=1 Tax=Occultella glacieicola TaxID=2518684 RepID=A0ABY2E9Q1_9MICO|nr:hypothetical protein [Occultella glacieicola]TDE96000.1 hypothetical protein EXU48_07075 [Occultella glacieicola]
MRQTLRRRLQAFAAATALGAILASCAIPVPEVDADPAPTDPVPVLDESRLERVLTSLEETIAAADEAGDASLLEPRVSGAALRVRTAEYALAAATASTETPYAVQPLTGLADVEIISNTEAWPHTVMVVTEIPDGANVPLLLTLEQATPRDEFVMTNWIRLFPAVTMPATTIGSIGSPQVPLDAEGLVLPPGQVVAAYADVLSNADSQYAASFAEDNLRSALTAELTALSTAVEEAGTVANTVTASTDPVLTLATEDGGAIVIGSMVMGQVFTKTIEDATLEVSGRLAVLAGGDGEVDNTLTAAYEQMVAFYVPPAAEGAQITVLGGEHVLSAVAKR